MVCSNGIRKRNAAGIRELLALGSVSLVIIKDSLCLGHLGCKEDANAVKCCTIMELMNKTNRSYEEDLVRLFCSVSLTTWAVS